MSDKPISDLRRRMIADNLLHHRTRLTPAIDRQRCCAA